MDRMPIRNLHSQRQIPPHWCSAVYDEKLNTCFLERKDKKSKEVETISWDDVKYQVESFLKEHQKV